MVPESRAAFFDEGGDALGEITMDVGITVRYDRIDNFWFTLLHELAHVFLHYQAGLAHLG